MSVCCTLRTNINFYQKSFETKQDVKDIIDIKERIIENCEKELMMFMTMTDPSKFWRESEAEVGETPLIWMQNEVTSLIESIKEETAELIDLYRLCNVWDECHDKDGKAIEPYMHENSSSHYFWGDFIDSVYPNGWEAHNVKKSILGKDYDSTRSTTENSME